MTRITYAADLLGLLSNTPALAGVPVVFDDATQDAKARMEDALSATGVVIAILPILGTSLAAQQSHRRSERALCALHVRSNQKRCAIGRLGEIIDTILDTLQAQDVWQCTLGHPGRDELTDLIPADSGLITYAVNFTIRIQKQTTQP